MGSFRHVSFDNFDILLAYIFPAPIAGQTHMTLCVTNHFRQQPQDQQPEEEQEQ